MFSPDGAFEEPGVLENHAKQVMDVFPGEVGNVLAVDANFATVQLVEPHEQVHQSRLACAGGTYNGHLWPGLAWAEKSWMMVLSGV